MKKNERGVHVNTVDHNVQVWSSYRYFTYLMATKDGSCMHQTWLARAAAAPAAAAAGPKRALAIFTTPRFL